MSYTLIETIIRDALWVLIFGGWAFLLVTGLEADKPSSGGIPGHTGHGEGEEEMVEGWFGRLGESAGWLLFGTIAATLPVILWWIFVTHP